MPTILNTRPIRQAKKMAEHFSKNGIDVINVPLIDIIVNKEEQEKLRLCEAKNFDIVICTSANAVWNAESYIKKISTDTTVIAVGPATKAELETIGVAKVLIPDEYNAESILGMPILKYKKTKKIIVLTGSEPLINLDDKLRDKGHDVNSYYVYNQIYSINDIIEYINNNDEHVSKVPSKLQIKKALEWCNIYKLPINSNSIYFKHASTFSLSS